MTHLQNDGLWSDRDVFIVGGGPSLKQFDFDTLRDCWTLGVNASSLLLNTKALFSLDRNWIHNAKRDYLLYSGEKHFAIPKNFPPNQKDPEATYYERCREPIATRLPRISGLNSGFGALNLALLKKSPRIFLLGFDLYIDNGSSHWHNNYAGGRNKSQYEMWAREYVHARRFADQLGILVLNVSPSSIITVFDKVDTNEFKRLIQ